VGCKFWPLPLTSALACNTAYCAIRVIDGLDMLIKKSTQKRVFSRMHRSVTSESIPTKCSTDYELTADEKVNVVKMSRVAHRCVPVIGETVATE